MSDLYSNDKIRLKSEELVQREVIYCVSLLVGDLRRMYHEVDYATQRDLSFDEDDLQKLTESRDYDEPADYHIRNNWDEDQLRAYLDDRGVEYVGTKDDDDEDTPEEDRLVDQPSTLGAELITLAIAAMQEQGAEAFCNEQSIDPNYCEVYEHWIVSSWLARKLDQKGYTTGELCGLTIWGRGTTGQAISMDSVMLEIANDLIKEYGE